MRSESSTWRAGRLAYFIATPLARALALRKPILSIQELSPRTMESCTVRECAHPILTASHRPHRLRACQKRPSGRNGVALDD